MQTSDDKSPSAPPTNLALFPTCDARGLITTLLTNRPGADVYEGYRADALFFAWLLDLPATVKPAAAATSVLSVAGLLHCTSDELQGVRGELHTMLLDLGPFQAKARQTGQSNSRWLKQPQKNPH